MHGLSKVQLPPLCDERWLKVLHLFCRVADGLTHSSSVSTHWVSHMCQKLQGDCKCKDEWKWEWSRSVMSDSLRPMDCSPQSSSIHGILQARIQKWVAISFSRGSSGPRDQTQVSCIAGRFFTTEPPGKPLLQIKCQLSHYLMLQSQAINGCHCFTIFLILGCESVLPHFP